MRLRQRAGAELRAFFDDTFLFTSVWWPYRLRHYDRPGGPQTLFSKGNYSEVSHARNLELLKGILSVHGSETGRTGWLSNGLGILAVKHSGKKFDLRSVRYVDDRMKYRQGVHFVGHSVTVHRKKGIKAKTKIYPTLDKTIANFISSDAAWALNYPDLEGDPEGASAQLEEWLRAPHDLAPVDQAAIKTMFPDRHFALRHWVRVK